MLAEAEDGAVRSIAFAASGQTGWVLPLYELALLTATTFARRNIHVELTLATPEPAPLSLFGDEASEAMRSLLKDRDIGLRTRCDPSRFEAGRLDLGAGGWLEVDRVVALPRLEGRRILGLEQDADGFVATDLSGRVLGQPDLYAAGDITDFPIKQGGIATQQADVVAEAISARAGAGLEPRRFAPVLRGLLLTGEAPRYLRKEGPTADVADDALWWPPNKIAGRYLAPFLARYGALEMGPPADRAAIEIEVEVESQTGTS
jgi:sulfide:quinone oxidoreductase